MALLKLRPIIVCSVCTNSHNGRQTAREMDLWGQMTAAGRAGQMIEARRTYHDMSSSILDRLCGIATGMTFSFLFPARCSRCWTSQVRAALWCCWRGSNVRREWSDEEPGKAVHPCQSRGSSTAVVDRQLRSK